MLGRMTLVPNLDRKQGENNAYLYVKVQLPHGGEEHWLLTDQEVRVAQENHARRAAGPAEPLGTRRPAGRTHHRCGPPLGRRPLRQRRSA